MANYGLESPISSLSSMERFLPGGFGSDSSSFPKIGSDETSLSSVLEKNSGENTAKIPIIIPAKIIPIIITLFTQYYQKISL